MKYVFRNWPIESIHKMAFKASEAAECAGDQNKFWERHRRLFENQAKLAPPDLVAHAQAEGLQMSAFQQCLDSGKYTARVRKDLADGRAVGITGNASVLHRPHVSRRFDDHVLDDAERRQELR